MLFDQLDQVSQYLHHVAVAGRVAVEKMRKAETVTKRNLNAGLRAIFRSPSLARVSLRQFDFNECYKTDPLPREVLIPEHSFESLADAFAFIAYEPTRGLWTTAFNSLIAGYEIELEKHYTKDQIYRMSGGSWESALDPKVEVRLPVLLKDLTSRALPHVLMIDPSLGEDVVNSVVAVHIAAEDLAKRLALLKLKLKEYASTSVTGMER
eukprot:GHVU01043553.1.p1 GENE.GHVU01043553.1~~GHVU01043553.1.p1  ORF type:complete len:209 (+),score=27.69 GHVU01043553.1:305-931(+)